ncbi:F-box/LRR-repeat protein At3g03360-like [Rutidosis leptorrhynchoides]|uniref:F-box/LRR-repeat protein At3g03360-like n=1 Tax=Rutidosis leptorrhynchoides TaxID=125765 RepID=UPI003A9A4491
MAAASAVSNMKEVERIHGPQLEDIPVDLIHRIQTLLPVKEAARMCVMLKSWLHAWSTTTTLRFHPPKKLLSKQQLKTYIDLINHTLQRYRVNNIPITSFDLHFRIINQESLPFVNKWIHAVASRSSLKELYLTISVLESITLPDELFLGENLDTVSVKADPHFLFWHSLFMRNNLVIKCVNLRVLELIDVTLSDETVVELLSTCILLEKINLSKCQGLSRIKVKNLHYLRELEITRGKRDSTPEIYDVPCLHIFKLTLLPNRNNLLSDSLESVRELVLNVEIMDDVYSNIISKFPFLDSLSLNISSCNPNVLDITSISLKRLNIYPLHYAMKIDIKAYAPKLDTIHYKGNSMPGLLFPSTASGQIELTLELFNRIDQSFFLKTREFLKLSNKFKIKIIACNSVFIVPFNYEIEDMIRQIQIPAMNVERLTFETDSHKGLWESPRLFLEELFCIMRPNYLTMTHPGIRGPLKLIAREMMGLRFRKGYGLGLKNVEIQNRVDGKWITLTSIWISSPYGIASLDYYCVAVATVFTEA